MLLHFAHQLPTLGLLFPGGQQGPGWPCQAPTVTMGAPQGTSPELGMEALGTQPVPRSSKGTPGTQPGSLGRWEGTQRGPVTLDKGQVLSGVRCRPCTAVPAPHAAFKGCTEWLPFWKQNQWEVKGMPVGQRDKCEIENLKELV